MRWRTGGARDERAAIVTAGATTRRHACLIVKMVGWCEGHGKLRLAPRPRDPRPSQVPRLRGASVCGRLQRTWIEASGQWPRHFRFDPHARPSGAQCAVVCGAEHCVAGMIRGTGCGARPRKPRVGGGLHRAVDLTVAGSGSRERGSRWSACWARTSGRSLGAAPQWPHPGRRPMLGARQGDWQAVRSGLRGRAPPSQGFRTARDRVGAPPRRRTLSCAMSRASRWTTRSRVPTPSTRRVAR